MERLVRSHVNPLDVAWSVLKTGTDRESRLPLSELFHQDVPYSPPPAGGESPFDKNSETPKTPPIQGTVACPVCGAKQDYSWKVTQSTPNYTSGGCEHPEGEQAMKDDYYAKLDEYYAQFEGGQE